MSDIKEEQKQRWSEKIRRSKDYIALETKYNEVVEALGETQALRDAYSKKIERQNARITELSEAIELCHLNADGNHTIYNITEDVVTALKSIPKEPLNE